MISRFIISALFAGALTGLIAGLLQLYFVQPVLLHAELYETGALVHFGADPVSAHPELPGFEPIRDGLSIIFTMLTYTCLLYTSPSPRDRQKSRMPSSA